MEIMRGRAVRSTAGRDKGRFLAVLGTEEQYATVADGSLRPLSRPKRKKLRHLQATATVFSEQELTSDRQLRAAIRKRFCSGSQEED